MELDIETIKRTAKGIQDLLPEGARKFALLYLPEGQIEIKIISNIEGSVLSDILLKTAESIAEHIETDSPE
jgi:hypothetical protein